MRRVSDRFRMIVAGSLGRGPLLVLLLAGLALGACGEPYGDPGDHRLETLRADPVSNLMAPGTSLVHTASTRAHKTAFSNRVMWPSVSFHYRLSGPPEQALSFYSSKLPELGWRFVTSFPYGQSQKLVYEKDFGGWKATLSVAPSVQQLPDQLLYVSLHAPPTTG